jgi:hypothetical protein
MSEERKRGRERRGVVLSSACPLIRRSVVGSLSQTSSAPNCMKVVPETARTNRMNDGCFQIFCVFPRLPIFVGVVVGKFVGVVVGKFVGKLTARVGGARAPQESANVKVKVGSGVGKVGNGNGNGNGSKVGSWNGEWKLQVEL